MTRYVPILATMLSTIAALMFFFLGYQYDHSQHVHDLMLNPMLAYPMAMLFLAAPFALTANEQLHGDQS